MQHSDSAFVKKSRPVGSAFLSPSLPACVPAAASLYRSYLSCVPSILLSVAVLPEKASCPIPAACSGVGMLPRNFGTFCPEVRPLAVLPQPGYSFSDGHSVFKVPSIDELP